FAFARLWKGGEQHVGDGEAEDPVAEEFQPVIRSRRPGGTGGAGMRQRRREQLPVGKLMSDAALQRRDRRGATRLHSRVKIRSARTVHGHCQNCQACAPSSTEKTMISARPTKFSSGTGPTALGTRLSVELSRLSPIMK